MKLRDLKAGTNTRRVRIFLAEKGVKLPTVEVDMMNGSCRKAVLRMTEAPSVTPIAQQGCTVLRQNPRASASPQPVD